MGKEKTNKIDNLITNALKNLNNLIDVNTIIGKPVLSENCTIIPVSKVTMGFLTGGGEYGDVKYFKKDENYPFSGGSGAVVSLKPMGFLINNGEGYKVVPVENTIYDKIAGVCESIVNSLNNNE